MKRLASCCFVLSLTIICKAQRPAQPPISNKVHTPASLGYELAWEDNFNGDKLDTGKWEVRGIGKRALGYVDP
ncbi:MAG: hypothetical protein QM802_18010, partial [Agriterribacter sp.]